MVNGVNSTNRIRTSEEDCKSSIYLRAKLLKNVLAGQIELDAEIFTACQSQAAFCRLASDKHNFCALRSKNTYYKYANIVLVESDMVDTTGKNGIFYIEWLRKIVSTRSLKQTDRSRQGTEERARLANTNIKDDREAALKDALFLTKAFGKLWADVRAEYMVCGDPVTKARLLNVLRSAEFMFERVFDNEIERTTATIYAMKKPDDRF